MIMDKKTVSYQTLAFIVAFLSLQQSFLVPGKTTKMVWLLPVSAERP
jgi:hypothetical protein